MRRQGWPAHYRIVLPILLLAFALRVAHLDAQSLWWDEAFSATVSTMDLRYLLETVLDDRVHPPLYYFLLHLWAGIGHSEFVLRALSAFLGVLAVAGLFPLANLVGGERLGTISAFALAIAPFHIWYSQETRMYSFAVFLVLMGSYFFLLLLDQHSLSSWLGYGGFTLLAMYTFYLTLFVIVAQMTYLLLMRQRYRALLGRWLVCMVAVGLLYAPWLVAIFLRGGFYQASISWIPAARPQDLFWTIYDFGLGSTSNSTQPLNVAAALLMVAILAYVSFQLVRANITLDQHRKLWYVWLWLVLPLVLIFLISLDWPLPQKRSIYMDRFLILQVPAFLILTSYGIMQILGRQKVLGTLAAVALLIAVGASIHSLLHDPTYHRDDWRQAITAIREGAQQGDVVLVRPHHYLPLHYYDLREIPWYTVPYLESKQEYDALLDIELPAHLGDTGRLWTMIVCENADPHRFVQGSTQRLMEKAEKDPVRAWLLENYQPLEESLYTGIHLALYGNN